MLYEDSVGGVIQQGGLVYRTLVYLMFIGGLFQFAVDARAETSTLLILGDSLTAGFGVLRSDSYPQRLEEIAREEGKDLRVLNAGISGDTSAGGLRRISGWLEKDFNLFMVALGGNDALRGLSTEALRENLESVLEMVRNAKPKVRLIVAGMRAPPNMGLEYENALVEAYQEAAKKFDATLIPFLLEGVAADPALNQYDGIHPNAEGHSIIAKHVWNSLLPLIP